MARFQSLSTFLLYSMQLIQKVDANFEIETRARWSFLSMNSTTEKNEEYPYDNGAKLFSILVVLLTYQSNSFVISKTAGRNITHKSTLLFHVFLSVLASVHLSILHTSSFFHACSSTCLTRPMGWYS